MSIDKQLDLEKTKKVESFSSPLWGRSLLARLLTELCNESRTGSLYAEYPSDESGFRVSDRTDSVIQKRYDHRVVAPDQSNRVHDFISYINRDLFEQSPASLAAGILAVKFSDEAELRYFTVFSRRSGKLGDFLQIDQFDNHL